MLAGMPKMKTATRGDAEAEQGRDVGLDLEDADGAQQDHDRDRGQQGRPQHAAGRIVDLRPDLRLHRPAPPRFFSGPLPRGAASVVAS
jgi:hypothetical protein